MVDGVRGTRVLDGEEANKYLEITLKNLKKNNYEIIKTQKDFLCLNEKFLKKF